MDNVQVPKRRLHVPNNPVPTAEKKLPLSSHGRNLSQRCGMSGLQSLCLSHGTALLVGLLVLLYNEVFVYYINKATWQYPPRFSELREDSKVVRLLIAGDPQLQGYMNEAGGLIGWITRWDSDRYLSTTFHLLLDTTRPDAVIILGDLLDEGSIASDVDYLEYVKRFHQIFHVPTGTKLILLAGDNDIGGEEDDFITDKKMYRFEQNFGLLNEVIQVKHVDLIKLNLVAPFQGAPVHRTRQNQGLSTLKARLSAPIRVLLSHVTLDASILQTAAEILGTFRPQYAFSAHFHEYQRRFYNITRFLKTARLPEPAHPVTKQTLTQEYQVPTCSYRMGTAAIGYMLVTIDDAGEMSTSVVWLPSRYLYLALYVVYLIVVVVFWLIPWACLGSRRHVVRW